MAKTISERVDVLLSAGIENPKKWAKVHGYSEPQHLLEAPICGECTWREEWERLRSHHLDETSFLFEMIGELVKRLNACPECKECVMVSRDGCLVCPVCSYARG